MDLVRNAGLWASLTELRKVWIWWVDGSAQGWGIWTSAREVSSLGCKAHLRDRIEVRWEGLLWGGGS